MADIGLKKKDFDFLAGEIDAWVQQNIISREQAENILSLYEIQQKNNLRIILFVAGIFLIGLGGASFIAAKWKDIPKIFRVFIFGGAYLASLATYGLAYVHGYKKTARVLLLTGSVIFGAGIHLLTRTYGINLAWYSSVGWWLVQIILTAVIFRDNWQLYLAQVISLVYLNAINAIDIFALQFANTARVPAAQFFSPVNAFILIAALFLTRIILKDRAAFIMNFLLALLLFASRMSLCFGGTWTLIIIALFGAVISFMPLGNDTQVFGLMMLGLFGLLLTWPEFWKGFIFYTEILPVCVAIFTALIMLVNIYRGHVITGIIFCFMLASRYFLDNLFGYMPKAWGFTLMGIIFMLGGFLFRPLRNFLERRKK